MFSFNQYFFQDQNYTCCKETMRKIQELSKKWLLIKPENIYRMFIAEGLISDKKAYIESEKSFTKAVIATYLVYGDARGRNNLGSGSNLFPLWKLAKLSSVFENIFTIESLKEMFYSQQAALSRSLKVQKKPVFTLLENTEKIQNSLLTNNQFSRKTIEIVRFPSISQISKSNNSFFNSESFLKFFFSMGFTETNVYWKKKLVNQILNLGNFEVAESVNLQTNQVTTQPSQKKMNTKKYVFSQNFYNILLEKFNFKGNVPAGLLYSWGSNEFKSTTHSVHF